MRCDVVVIGGGLAGLSAALRASALGAAVTLVSRGQGSVALSSGMIDLLGYLPSDVEEALLSPLNGLQQVRRLAPAHPYARVDVETALQALLALRAVCERQGLPYDGDPHHNALLPTSLGTWRPTCLYPRSMAGGALKHGTRLLVASLATFRDLPLHLCVSNLSAYAAGQGVDLEARGIVLDPPLLRGRHHVETTELAFLFEDRSFRAEVARALQLAAGAATVIGMPAVLGVQRHAEAWLDLQEQAGLPIFEIPTLPPSMPGARLYHALIRELEQREGVTLLQGHPVGAVETGQGRCHRITVAGAGRDQVISGRSFVLATGRLLGEGLRATQRGLCEPVFALPVDPGLQPDGWAAPSFLASEGHAFLRAGLRVNERFQPLDASGHIVYENVFAAGSLLGGYDWTREKSGNGVATVTGFAAATHAVSSA